MSQIQEPVWGTDLPDLRWFCCLEVKITWTHFCKNVELFKDLWVGLPVQLCLLWSGKGDKNQEYSCWTLDPAVCVISLHHQGLVLTWAWLPTQLHAERSEPKTCIKIQITTARKQGSTWLNLEDWWGANKFLLILLAVWNASGVKGML